MTAGLLPPYGNYDEVGDYQADGGGARREGARP
jgi:hypothetical protein